MTHVSPAANPTDAPIPLVDLKAAYHRQKDEIDAAIRAVVENTRFIQGLEVVEHERAFAAFTGTRYCLGTGSGTASIHLILAALGIGPGDEVAVPAHTFIASAEPISWRGARPRFVDVDPVTGCLDPDALKASIDGVKAVIGVHIHGRPFDLDAVGAVTTAAGVPLIEDAAQAHGADYIRADGTVVRAGTYGIAAAFSYYPGKNLGAFGDAGSITTNDEALYEQMRLLRDHGSVRKYEHQVVGFADRLDTLQAAVLNVKLPRLAEGNERRRALAALFTEKLTGVGDLWIPPETPNRRSVYHHYVIRTKHRDALHAYLNERGIGATIHYPRPVHLQPAYAFLGHRRGEFPNAEAWADEVLSLPIYPELTEAQLDRIVAEVKAFFAGR
jgi:dTDP-4-amino-4,6-dideoxygalactose transaminase